jgi:hypothetical protein
MDVIMCKKACRNKYSAYFAIYIYIYHLFIINLYYYFRIA